MDQYGEQMMSEVVATIYEMVPALDVDKVRNRLSSVFLKYDVYKNEAEEDAPDVEDKIKLFISSKN